MAGQRDLLRKITSLENTKKVTSAMRMIASTKLQRLQKIQTRSKDFGLALEAVNAGLKLFDRDLDMRESYKLPPYFTGKLHLVMFTGDRGLCGSFNAGIQKLTKSLIANARGESCSITALGAKGVKFCETHDLPLSARISPLPKLPRFEIAAEAADKFLEDMAQGRYDEVLLLFNRFVSTLEQVPTIARLVPTLKNADFAELVPQQRFYEPSLDETAKTLVRQAARYRLYLAMVESMTSENAARMTAMENASTNCGNLIEHYKLIFNRSRQSAITTELLEIIAGTEAMK